MTQVREETWALPEVDTVFKLLFGLNVDERMFEGHYVHVTCVREPIETLFVPLHSNRPSPVALHFKSGYHLRGKMSVILQGGRGDLTINVNADLRYDRNGLAPVQYFQGLVFRIDTSPPPPPPPTPPLPPDPDRPDEDDPRTIVSPAYDALFPYVYVRRWPRIPEENRAYGFIVYVASSPPSSSFARDLAEAASRGRQAMEALAIAFVDGASPYKDQFVATPGDLPWPVAGFVDMALMLRQLLRRSDQRDQWVDTLRIELAALLDGEPEGYLQSPAYRDVIDRVWQSYFALVVLLGYDQALLTDLALTLWFANAAGKALVVDPQGKFEVAPDLTAGRRALLAEASVLLPTPLFPMPPATRALTSSRCPGDHGWVEPYAIGDLQMVRQRLVRYAAGEIARIENVMRGERRKVSSRHGRQQIEVQLTHYDEQQKLCTDGADARNSLTEETSRVVVGKTVSDSFVNFSANYGPPTQATLNGTQNRVTSAGLPGSDEITRFAREILSKTVNSIARKVGSRRSSSTVSQSEETTLSVIDNSAGKSNLCAVYRWVNKIFEACVVNYGNRLIMEFMVRRPGARIVDATTCGPGRQGDRPVEPERIGIASFKDIKRHNYAQLCAVYGVTDITPPPARRKFVTATVRAGDAVQIAIPAGYCARTARAAYVSPPGIAGPAVLVGNQSMTPGTNPTALPPYGEEATVPVSVADAADLLSPPSSADVLVNVEIECAPAPRRNDEWRIAIYAAVVNAYQQSLELRRDAVIETGPPAASRSPLACREIERGALKRSCKTLLMERAAQMTGNADAPASPPSPPTAVVDAPRMLQFLDETLEWHEMTYMSVPDEGTQRDESGGDQPHAGGDALFDGFLHASYARVLVPVQPDRVLAFLYMLASGMIWDGPDWLVAVNTPDLHIVDDLKRIARDGLPERRMGAPWEIVVPTTMQVLDDLDRPPQGKNDLTVVGASK